MDLDQGFGKEHRVRRSAEYRFLGRRGSRFRTPHFVVLYHPGRVRPRFGITVSRKVGKAVQRNAIKRRLREFIRTERQQLERPWTMVFIAQTGAAELTTASLREELGPLFGYLNRREYRPRRGRRGSSRGKRR